MTGPTDITISWKHSPAVPVLEYAEQPGRLERGPYSSVQEVRIYQVGKPACL